MVLTVTEDHTAELWDTSNGQRRASVSSVQEASLTPDSKVLAVAYTSGDVRFWNPAFLDPRAAVVKVCASLNRDLLDWEREQLPAELRTVKICQG